MIISGGVNIYPAEIESVLLTHPKVGDVAVFGIPHEDWGEEVKAVVEPAAGRRAGRRRSPPRSSRSARDKLAKFKLPKIDRLHRRDAARPERQALQAQAARPVLGGPRQGDLTFGRGSAGPTSSFRRPSPDLRRMSGRVTPLLAWGHDDRRSRRSRCDAGACGPGSGALAPDLARGIMLLLIVLSNTAFHLWAARRGPSGWHPVDGSWIDHAVQFTMITVLDMRIYPLFAFLFGYGMMQLVSSGRPPPAPRSATPRGCCADAAVADRHRSGALHPADGGRHRRLLRSAEPRPRPALPPARRTRAEVVDLRSVSRCSCSWRPSPS